MNNHKPKQTPEARNQIAAEAAMKKAISGITNEVMIKLANELAKKNTKCMPGGMIGVGRWVENTRDDIPDLVTSEAVGGRSEKETRANSRRIAACWNALSMFSTEEIENSHFFTMGMLEKHIPS